MTQITTEAYQPIDREVVWAALFAWLQSKLNTQFKSMGRKHTPPPDLTPKMQPALFQVATRETRMPQKPPGLPNRLLLRGYLIVYAYDDSPIEDIGTEQNLAETRLNGLLKAIDQALLPDDPTSNKFTINGRVTHCWIEGDADIDPGIFGSQAAAVLPLYILT